VLFCRIPLRLVSSFGEGSPVVAATICWRRSDAGKEPVSSASVAVTCGKKGLAHDKRAIFEQIITLNLLMAGSNESTKETSAIEVSVPPSEKSPDPKLKARKSAQIQLPAHEAMDKTPVPILVPAPIPAGGAHAEDPRHETGSVSHLADLTAAEMKKTPPPKAMSDAAAHDSSVAAAPGKNSMLLIWLLLGFSALILIIQIWTYFS